MIAQIIFFVALALFIFIIAHKMGLIDIGEGKFRWIGVGAFGRIGQTLKQRLSTIKLPKRIKKEDRANYDNIRKEDEPVESKESFWQSDSSDQVEVLSYFDLAQEAIDNHNLDEAEKLLIKAASHSPQDAKIYARLGFVYLEKKNYNDAIEALRLAVKYDKANPSRHFNLALAYYGNKDKQRAIASVRSAIALDPVSKKYGQFLEQLLKEE